MVLRYEDLCADPDEAMRQVSALVSQPIALRRTAEGGFEIPMAHSASGNPVRFDRSPIFLRADDEWKAAMPSRRKAAVTALSLPMLPRYSYDIRVS